MYEAKYRNKDCGKTIHMVFENTTSILDTIVTINATNIVDEIFSVCLSKFSEVYYSKKEAESLKWYEVSLTGVSYDTKDKPCKKKYHILVQAPNFDDCCETVREIAKMGYEMERHTIRESSITDVTTLTVEVDIIPEKDVEND